MPILIAKVRRRSFTGKKCHALIYIIEVRELLWINQDEFNSSLLIQYERARSMRHSIPTAIFELHVILLPVTRMRLTMELGDCNWSEVIPFFRTEQGEMRELFPIRPGS
jgi:hypothetical protein